MKKNVKERFLEYIKWDTKSDEENLNCPSSNGQMEFAKFLVEEIKNIGIKDVSLDENGYIIANIEGELKNVPKVAFIAHMDTAPDMDGKCIDPQIIENYNGEDIILNKENNIILSNRDFPELKNYKGKTLITTRGNTLLGADDKAGISEIITAVENIINSDLKHGDIKIAFTPDEEIGRGADKFNVEKLDADFAYTIDGGEIGELEYENFNAAVCKIAINGRNVHPGSAKDKMVNSIELAMEFNSMLPNVQKPEHTEHYEGFYHLIDFKGSVEKTDLTYIIRDHCMDKFNKKKELIEDVTKYLGIKYENAKIDVNLKDQYYNMKEKIEPVKYIVDIAKEAMIDAQVEPNIKPIRGGTDGARLSFMGLPTPNIFTGGHNFHGKYEYIPVESMEKTVEVISNIVKNISKLSK